MANVLLFVVWLCIFVQFGTCYKNGDEKDVTDPIANHPIIKQLVARVEYLEDKDKLNTELIGKLRGELEKYNARGGVTDFDELTPVEEIQIVSDVDSDIYKNNQPRKSEEKDENSHNSKKRNSVERIRQVRGEGTVAFLATAKSSHTFGQNQNIIFDSVVTNIGNVYNPHHGIFIAPVPGTYVLHSTVLASNNAELWTHFAVNGRNIANMYARGTDGRHDSGSQMIVVELNQGDDVSIQSNNEHENVYGGAYTTFSGFLLSETIADVIG